MRLSKDLIGKTIVSVEDGRRIGTVRDVYLDPDLQWLAGIHLGKEGLISRKSLLIPRQAVAVFGVDYVLTTHSDAVSDEKQLPEAESWLRLDHLEGREVDTTGGTKIGVIGDVLLDEQARIIAFSLSRVFVEGPVAESRTIYQEAVVDHGHEDGLMTIDLARAEAQSGLGEEMVAEGSPAEASAAEPSAGEESVEAAPGQLEDESAGKALEEE